MFHRPKLDARRIDPKTKKAVLFEDLLGDNEKEKAKPEEPAVPEGEEELTPVRQLPGAPKGMHGEVNEEYTPMTPEEIEEKRKEQEKQPAAPAEEKAEIPATFRDVMKNLLKKESPESKRKNTMEEKYGSPEEIKKVIDSIEPYSKQLADADFETVEAIINRSPLADILKDRANTIFNSKSPGDFSRANQLALNLLGATTRKQVQDADEWLTENPQGQEYSRKVFNLYRIRRVMNLLSNTILAMEGQSVIAQPKGTPRTTKEQKAEKKRILDLSKLLEEGRITDTEFQDAKRTGMTANELLKKRTTPQKENIADRVEREYREEEAREAENRSPEASRLNMKKVGIKPTYTALLLTKMTQAPDINEVSSNWNATGSEAVVSFQSDEENEPQLYHIQVTPMSLYKTPKDLAEENAEKENAEGENDYSWGPEGPPPGIANASKLNMKKHAEGDVTGPGGPEWEYEWTSGPTPTKEEPTKRRKRFPFHNRPSQDTAINPGGEQGNLFEVGPQGGQSDMNFLSRTINSMEKTANNELFSTFSFENGENWLTYTLFRKAYSKFRKGDIVIQYGNTASECNTFRRRFGSVEKAEKEIHNVLYPIFATFSEKSPDQMSLPELLTAHKPGGVFYPNWGPRCKQRFEELTGKEWSPKEVEKYNAEIKTGTLVGKPTQDEPLSEIQKGHGEPGGYYGPRTGPYDKKPWHGNRDGFDAKNPPRTRTQRNFIPYMDTADDAGVGFIGGRTMGKVDKKQGLAAGDYAVTPVETPENRAGTIEQPPVKPINHDPKRPQEPKKRYDTNEVNITGIPPYQGEDSNEFDKSRMRLSMKKNKKADE